MKKNRVMTCLAVGVCVLAVSATAAFGSVNGYANYKTAVKELALKSDNFSAQAAVSVTYDGKTVMSGKGESAKDGKNFSMHYVLTDGKSSEESFDTTLNGVNTWFNASDAYYYTADAGDTSDAHGLLGVTEDDELSNRIINFLEMGADTVMGDLKNNVVEIGSSNGDYTYQLDISSSQVPAVVNAGLSVLAYAMSENVSNTSYVDFEDWDLCAVRYYQQQTGEQLSQDFLDHYRGEVDDDRWWENNEELDKFEELQGEMHGHYYEELEQKMDAANSTSGVLYVANDGTTTFYPDVVAYERGKGVDSMDDIEDFVGEDLILDNVHFTFSVNKAGQLTANHCEATFKTVDKDGGAHTMVLTSDVTLGEYGTTVVQPLDVGDRISWEEYASESAAG